MNCPFCHLALLISPRLFNNVDTAKEKSAAYTPQLLEILDTATIRKQVNKTCPQLLNVSAQELMKRIVDEIAVAELVKVAFGNIFGLDRYVHLGCKRNRKR